MSVIRKHLSDVLGLACAALWPWVYYLPVTLGQQVFAEGDINWLFSPIRAELARALNEGSLPLWTPGLEGGFPLFAEGEVGALYPLNVIAYRLLPVYVANSYTVLFNFMWASLGMYLLARSSRWRTPSALVAAFAFSASGFMAAHLSHLPHVAAASWLPWLILFAQRYWHDQFGGKSGTWWFAFASFSIGLVCLAGFPQIAAINIAVYALCGLIGPVLWGNSSNNVRAAINTLLRWSPRATIFVASSVLLGLGIGSIQLLPSFELMGLSIRNREMGEYFFSSYSLDPAYLTQFLLPFWKMGIPQPSNMEYWGYIGIFPLFLAFAAVALRRNSRTVFFLFLAALAIALALGGNNPTYQWLYNVPLFNRLRVPARFLFLFTFASAYLAGMGLEALLERASAGIGNRLVYACAAFFLALFGGGIFAAYTLPMEFWMGIWGWLPFVLIAASAGLVVLIRFGKPSAFLLATMVLGLTVFDLAMFRAPFVEALSGLALPSEWIQAPRTIQSMDNASSVYRVFAEKSAWTPAAARGSLWNNIALLYGKQAAKPYLPSLGLQRNQTYIDEMTLGMRNLMNIRYYLLPLEVPDDGASFPATFDDSEPSGGLTIDLLSQQPAIPATRVTGLSLVSYTDHTGDLPNGQLVGEIKLGMSTGQVATLPIRIGQDTADWDWDMLAESGSAKHRKPEGGLGFPAYLKSFGKTFTGYRYPAMYTLSPDRAPMIVTSVGIRSLLPGADLTVERIDLIDESGQAMSLAALLHRNDLALAFRSHTAAMWENRDVLPRAFVAHAVQTVSDEEALARMKEPDFPYSEVALLSEPPLHALPLPLRPPVSDDSVTIVSYAAQRVVIQAKTNQAGYLVLTDSWYPGWVATVDNQPAPIYRADYIFRAVDLAPGEHIVTFEYRPLSFSAGALLCVSSLFFIAYILFRFGRKARPQ